MVGELLTTWSDSLIIFFEAQLTTTCLEALSDVSPFTVSDLGRFVISLRGWSLELALRLKGVTGSGSGVDRMVLGWSSVTGLEDLEGFLSLLL